MHLNMIDIVKVALAWIVVTFLILRLVRFTRHAKVACTFRSAYVIATRLLFFYAATFAIFCVCLGIPIDAVLIVTSLVLLVSPLVTVSFVEGFIAGPPVHAALGVFLVMPFFVIKQFILDFPDRDKIVLAPPAEAAVSNDLSRLVSAVGTVVAILRPAGKVEIAGITYSAATADGKFLDRGAAVKVTGVRNTMLIVSAIELLETPPDL